MDSQKKFTSITEKTSLIIQGAEISGEVSLKLVNTTHRNMDTAKKNKFWKDALLLHIVTKNSFKHIDWELTWEMTENLQTM